MSERWRISVQQHDFDPGVEIESLRNAAAGAIVSFVGVARDFSDDFPVERITLEHYPGMTERSLEDIVRAAHARWNLTQVRVIHRFGELRPGDRIVLVATASSHREHAFDACRFIIDYLKTQAPFWKQESGNKGERWVQSRQSDERARENWDIPQDLAAQKQ
ncbi:MAG TPA: molybdenum cofactor biosynthesis protein MoaE [Burkholderiaceae bacterium]|nr:molybdenum cofactor biosynthesis protein MoaE [Burkholderiaceae bacterium]